jgi:hypothetical protein
MAEIGYEITRGGEGPPEATRRRRRKLRAIGFRVDFARKNNCFLICMKGQNTRAEAPGDVGGQSRGQITLAV